MNAANSAAGAPHHPLLALWQRYLTVTRSAWRQRHALAGPERRADEAAFLPAHLSLQVSPPHPAPRRAALAICALFVIALAWAWFGELDIVAVAPGRIVVSDRTKAIQPLEAGVVKAIHVKDGDRVAQGQLLVELDATAPQADNHRLAQEQAAAAVDRGNSLVLLAALDSGALPAANRQRSTEASVYADAERAGLQLQAEWADISAKLAKLDAEMTRRRAEAGSVEQQILKLQTTLPLAQQREADFRALADQGFVSSHAGQDRTRERIEQERDLGLAQARRHEAAAALHEAEQARAAYVAETRRVLRDRETQSALKQAQLGEEAVKARHRERLTRLVSPVAGTVQQRAVHAIGGVVTPAQTLMVIVPDGAEVSAEVVLENKDIGFVHSGQGAEVKFETFPYTRYGTVHARVTGITADAVTDEKRGAIFPATLVLDQSELTVEGQAVRLAPGMNLTAEIKTGRRRVIDYLMDPVRATAGSSLKER